MVKSKGKEIKNDLPRERKLSTIPAHISSQPADETTVSLLRELVSHLRKKRNELREEWAKRIMGTKLLTAMTRDSCRGYFRIYNYVEALETGTYEALQA
ncbi:MAG: hypothetical protein WD016_09125 [Balneolaceae bacterium]